MAKFHNSRLFLMKCECENVKWVLKAIKLVDAEIKESSSTGANPINQT